MHIFSGQNVLTVQMTPTGGGTVTPRWAIGTILLLTSGEHWKITGVTVAGIEVIYTAIWLEYNSTSTVSEAQFIASGATPTNEDPTARVTVTVRISNYDSRAKYWIAMPSSIFSMVPVPVSQAITWSNVPANDIKAPKVVLVDIYDGNPDAGGQSLRGVSGYPNLAQGVGFSSLLINGEVITWRTDLGTFQDQSGNYL